MDNTQLREELIVQADGAFLVMAGAVNDLLEVAGEYADTHPVRTISDQIKSSDLQVAVFDMAKAIKMLSNILEFWKREETPVFSKMGIELNCLNELRSTIDATALFFERQDPKFVYGMGAVNQAHAELVRCNRLL